MGAYDVGYLLGFCASALLFAGVASFVISKFTGSWNLGLFGVVLLCIALLHIAIIRLGGRHGEPIA